MNDVRGRMKEKVALAMPGCTWWLTLGDHDDAKALLREALGPGPYLPGLAGYAAIMNALDVPKNKTMRNNKLVKSLLGATLHADRAALMKLCVATWGICPHRTAAPRHTLPPSSKLHLQTLTTRPRRSCSSETTLDNLDKPLSDRSPCLAVLGGNWLRPFSFGCCTGATVDVVLPENPAVSVTSPEALNTPGRINVAVLATCITESLGILAGGARGSADISF